MARVTVEDCLTQIENQFELTLVAAKRARQIARGADPRVDMGNDKSTVVALREIAECKVNKSVLDEEDLPPVQAISPGLAALEVPQDTNLDFNADI